MIVKNIVIRLEKNKLIIDVKDSKMKATKEEIKASNNYDILLSEAMQNNNFIKLFK